MFRDSPLVSKPLTVRSEYVVASAKSELGAGALSKSIKTFGQSLANSRSRKGERERCASRDSEYHRQTYLKRPFN
ncbi:hypothetical protein TNCV_664791 [Trichonephila clavipes]|nr:hypothetical protein TNCV_664791 [Trichonephila clavipes]